MQVIGFINEYIETNSFVAAAINLTSFVEVLTWPSNTASCASQPTTVASTHAVDSGLGRDDVEMAYDNALFSYAGCRCISGYDNIYTFDASGKARSRFLALQLS